MLEFGRRTFAADRGIIFPELVALSPEHEGGNNNGRFLETEEALGEALSDIQRFIKEESLLAAM